MIITEKVVRLVRGTKAKLLAAGLLPGQIGIIWDDPAKPRLAIGDRSKVPQEVIPGEHTHVIADTIGLQTALDAKAAGTHTHTTAQVVGLADALDAKAASNHTHTSAQVTGLADALAGKAAASHTHAISDTTGLQEALNAKAASSHVHVISDMTGLQEALDSKVANKRETVALAISSSTGTVDLGKVFEVLDETASAVGRFRLYRTVEGRNADLARPITCRTISNKIGILLEDVFTARVMSISERPAPGQSGSDGLCAWSWSGTVPATITLTLLVKEP